MSYVGSLTLVCQSLLGCPVSLKLDSQSWKWLSSHYNPSLTEGSERLVKSVRPVSLELDLQGDKGIDEVILPLA